MPDAVPDPMAVAHLFSRCCDEAGVPCALFGGLASIAHARVRPTLDVDVLIAVEKVRIPSFLGLLRQRGFAFDEPEVTRHLSRDGLAQVAYQGVRVDLLMPVLPFFQEALNRRSMITLGDKALPFVRAEDLVVMKMIAFRPRDQEDVRTLLAAPGHALDKAFIRARLGELTEPGDGKIDAFERWVREQEG